jgi:hypothetical protein
MEDNKPSEESAIAGTAKEVAKPVLQALLSPSAELLGQELRAIVERKLQDWKSRKRTENISSHLREASERIKQQGVQGEDPISPIDSIKQSELFLGWVDGAQDVEPDGSILADIWQQLLVEIAKGQVTDKLLVDTLKKVDPAEAILILELRDRGSMRAHDEKEGHYLMALS